MECILRSERAPVHRYFKAKSMYHMGMGRIWARGAGGTVANARSLKSKDSRVAESV